MREVIRERMGDVEPCHYLPDRLSMMRYRIIDDCTRETYQRMLERGWRRFGRLFFRHGCSGCLECRSLRVHVDRFRPNRSMRRTLRRNRDLRVIVRPPSLTRQHLDLYDRYHADMSRRKGWPEKVSEPFDYHLTFVQGHQDFGYELLYMAEDRLICVALVDILPQAVSAVYAFYDPDERDRSLGVYSILQQIELARARDLPYLNLGYWIADNPSMAYKGNYRPHQILEGRPASTEEPVWKDVVAGEPSATG